MLRGSAFSGAYRKLKFLYALEDPWNLKSAREQHRFVCVNAQLGSIAKRYGTVLELGCGEGHQTVYLRTLSDRLYGVDLSEKAIKRARRRCPDVEFVAAKVENAHTVVAEPRFDLITACEVLYYARQPDSVLPVLQSRTDRLYVTNFRPRSEKLRQHFVGEGWRRLDDIRHEKTVWECFLWEAPAIVARRAASASAWLALLISAVTADASFACSEVQVAGAAMCGSR